MSARGGPEIAVILLDENGTIVDAHASCAEVFGWPREEIIGKDVRELLQYGRDLLMSQLHLLEENDDGGNTSFTIRVLARRKDQQQFPARATVRRFRELECWTVAFYHADSDSSDTSAAPGVSPQEIALAKRALEEGAAGRTTKSIDAKSMSVSRLWRNSRLLFNSRDETTAAQVEPAVVAAAEFPNEKQIIEQAAALAAQCAPSALETPAGRVSESIKAPVENASPVSNTASAPVVPVISPEPPAPSRLSIPEPAMTHFEPAEPRISHSRFDTHSVAGGETASLARLKAELEKERGERARMEQRAASLSSQVQGLHLQVSESLNLERENQTRVTALEQELHSTLESFANCKVDLENLRRDQRSAEDQLCVVRELNEQLQENLRLFENARKTLEGAQADVRTQLERSNSTLKQAESDLDKEREARQHLEQSHANALREHRAFEQKAALQIAELQTALETARIEKSRAQEDILRSRAECLTSINEAAGRVNRLRANFTCVLTHINGTTRELLQSPLTDEQKIVIESLLQDVISLESTLETEVLSPETGK